MEFERMVTNSMVELHVTITERFHEAAVLGLFFALVLLQLFREPQVHARMSRCHRLSQAVTSFLQGRRKMQIWSAKRIKYVICLLVPFALAPLAALPYKEAKCGYIILWMAVYWVLEPVHLTVTALMPVALMPLFGILDSTVVVENYMKEVLMMFIGGLGVAIAVEHCNLHERVALKVLLTLGVETKWLMLGFMLTTMFLSMWISNTATTAMMVPIIEAVMTELRKKENDATVASNTETLHKALLLSVAYSANCGGTGTITGTSPNMIFKGYMDEWYPKSSEITYASWMAYNVPGMLLCVIAGWLLLQVVYAPCWRTEDEGRADQIKAVITARYRELGKMSFHEAAVLGLFIVLVLLWVFREPKFMPGWVDVIGSDKKIGDAVPAIAVLFLMFLLPANPSKPHKSPALLTWKAVQEKLPWGLVLLLGGGYALSDGAVEKLPWGLVFLLGGAYALTGGAVVKLPWGLVLLLGGAYALTGGAVEKLPWGLVLLLGGAYVLTGGAIKKLPRGLVLLLGGDSALSDGAVEKLSWGVVLLLGGAYGLTGGAVEKLPWGLVLLLGGAYALTGGAVEKLPWGLVLLLGGGCALTDDAVKSGLSNWLGNQMSVLSVLSPAVVLLIVCIFTAAMTEVMSNSTVTTMLLPVVNQMAITFRVHPLYFMLPVAIVASYAFMLPVATGPNAIVFGTGYLETTDMMKPGIFMNVIACAVQLFMIHTLGAHIFHLHEYPSWGNSTELNHTIN